MTTIQSPSHALGLMTMTAYNKIFEVLPECLTNPDGPRKVYSIILGVDAMLCSYRSTMWFNEMGEDGLKQVGYVEKIRELKGRKTQLRLGNAVDNEKWVDWFHDYLTLLSSCFNHLGLGPALEDKEIMDDAIIEAAEDNPIRGSFETQDDTATLAE